MNYCKDCKWFTDGHYSKTYISPTCTQRGTDSAAYMRAFVCGVENPTLFEPRAPKPECAVDIYVLRCPKSGEVRYAGKANNAQARLKSHLRDCKRRNTPVYCWMRSLLAAGMTPTIEVVQQVTSCDWAKAETELIAKLRADGVRLLNLADGGDQPSQTKEQRQSAGRAAVKARTKTPEAKRVYQLKHRIGILLRSGVSDAVKAKLRYAATKRPDLFGEWVTL